MAQTLQEERAAQTQRLLEGKVTIITGASRGIGKATARIVGVDKEHEVQGLGNRDRLATGADVEANIRHRDPEVLSKHRRGRGAH